jgi:uncharacterized protein (DUF1501 family)
MYNEEKIMFLQNVGYPNPNLSHFRSKEIMLSASASKEVVSSGWFGRYLEKLHPEYPEDYPNITDPHPLAISIGNNGSPTCQGNINNMSVVLKNLNTSYQTQSENANFPDTPYGFELDYITQVMKSTEKYLEVVSNSADLSETLSTHWPEGNSLADKLKIVARLISGGLTTPIYIVNMGGFDTHSNQIDEGSSETGKHANLLKKVSEATFAFQNELKIQDKEDNVISLVYSEFGRRVGSNQSNGTDHGAAFPMMLFGSRVNPVVFGENPEIPEEVEKKTNVPMKIDFRSVYASILELWFNVEKSEINEILSGEFEILPILKNAVSTESSLSDSKNLKILPVYPNPVSNEAQIQFFSKGGKLSLKLYSFEGKEIRRLVEGNFPAGNQYFTFNRRGLNSGNYLLVLQNKNQRVTQKIIIQ